VIRVLTDDDVGDQGFGRQAALDQARRRCLLGGPSLEIGFEMSSGSPGLFPRAGGELGIPAGVLHEAIVDQDTLRLGVPD
jgi:hypothetical protein